MSSSLGVLRTSHGRHNLCVALGLLFLFSMSGNAQVVIKERISLNGLRDIKVPVQGGTGALTLQPLYLQHGGTVELVLNAQIYDTVSGWCCYPNYFSLHEATLGELSHSIRDSIWYGSTVSDSTIELGNHNQWTRFDFSIIDSTLGLTLLPDPGSSDQIASSSGAYLFFLNPADTVIDMSGYPNHHSWAVMLSPVEGTESFPPSEVLAFLGNPFVPSPQLVAPIAGEAVLAIRSALNADELRTELPQDGQLASDVSTMVGETIPLGRVDSGDVFRFYLRSSQPLVGGMNMYPENSYPEPVQEGEGEIVVGGLDFEDGTDLDFGDAGVLFYVVPDRVGGIPGPIVVEASKTEASPGDTVDFHVRGRAEDGTLVEYDADMTFSVALVRGADYGTLVSPDGEEEGDELFWTAAGFRLVVADTMSLDEVEIGIRVSPNISLPSRPGQSHGGRVPRTQREGVQERFDPRSNTSLLSLRGNSVKGKSGPQPASIQDEPITGVGFASVMVKQVCQVEHHPQTIIAITDPGSFDLRRGDNNSFYCGNDRSQGGYVHFESHSYNQPVLYHGTINLLSLQLRIDWGVCNNRSLQLLDETLSNITSQAEAETALNDLSHVFMNDIRIDMMDRFFPLSVAVAHENVHMAQVKEIATSEYNTALDEISRIDPSLGWCTMNADELMMEQIHKTVIVGEALDRARSRVELYINENPMLLEMPAYESGYHEAVRLIGLLKDTWGLQ
ncbi:MAG: hypothetical protein HW407_784 [Bacteroidetes bacterium]|nr:hypothetical protein [Bacteroidota bacterium]